MSPALHKWHPNELCQETIETRLRDSFSTKLSITSFLFHRNFQENYRKKCCDQLLNIVPVLNGKQTGAVKTYNVLRHKARRPSALVMASTRLPQHCQENKHICGQRVRKILLHMFKKRLNCLKFAQMKGAYCVFSGCWYLLFIMIGSCYICFSFVKVLEHDKYC